MQKTWKKWQSILVTLTLQPTGWLDLQLNLTVIASAIQFAHTKLSQLWDPKLPSLWQHKNELCLVQLFLQPQTTTHKSMLQNKITNK